MFPQRPPWYRCRRRGFPSASALDSMGGGALGSNCSCRMMEELEEEAAKVASSSQTKIAVATAAAAADVRTLRCRRRRRLVTGAAAAFMAGWAVCCLWGTPAGGGIRQGTRGHCVGSHCKVTCSAVLVPNNVQVTCLSAVLVRYVHQPVFFNSRSSKRSSIINNISSTVTGHPCFLA